MIALDQCPYLVIDNGAIKAHHKELTELPAGETRRQYMTSASYYRIVREYLSSSHEEATLPFVVIPRKHGVVLGR